MTRKIGLYGGEVDFCHFDFDGVMGPQSSGSLSEYTPVALGIADRNTNGYSVITGRSVDYVKGIMDSISDVPKPVAICGEHSGMIELDDGTEIKFPARYEFRKFIEQVESSIEGNCIKIPMDDVPCCIEPGKNVITTISFDPKYNKMLWNASDERVSSYVQKAFEYFANLVSENGYKGHVEMIANSDSVEFLPSGLWKPWGMEFISRILCSQPGRSLVVGDSGSDIPMMRLAGYSGAPSNSSDEVKREVMFMKGHVSGYPDGKGLLDIVTKMTER